MSVFLSLSPGSEVISAGKRYVIQSAIGFDAVIAVDATTNATVQLLIKDLTRPEVTTEPAPDIASVDSVNWDLANARRKLIKPLVDAYRVPKKEMDRVCSELGVHRTTVKRWVRTYRASGEKTTSLIRSRQRDDKGKSRLPNEVEAIMHHTIAAFYLKDKRSKLDTAREVQLRCRNAQQKPPHQNTIYNRIARIPEQERLKKQGHKKAADRYNPTPGKFDEALAPLSVVQMDHALLDVVVVDHQTRRAIGRPTITLAFDVFSRSVLGFYLSLEKNGGALATGQCIVHAAFPKETWLASRNVPGSWPCWGFPKKLHVDNAKDFRGSMVERACEEFHMDIDFRPVQTPNFGGAIERFYGTLQREMHKLPGTTFSSPEQRGDYDSNKEAKLSLTDLEGVIADWIINVYHTRVHSGIKMSPERLWHHGIFVGDEKRPASGLPERPDNLETVRLHFMPHANRFVTPNYGIQWDNVRYYHDVLRPYVGDKQSYIVKRDPRDISAIFFYHEDSKTYSKIPYLNISYPEISIWEFQAIERQLKVEGLGQVDEAAIFEAYERIAHRIEHATKQTTQTRRAHERRLAAKSAAPATFERKTETDTPVDDTTQLTASRFAHVKAFEVKIL